VGVLERAIRRATEAVPRFFAGTPEYGWWLMLQGVRAFQPGRDRQAWYDYQRKVMGG
jgi:hypothetical protein